MDHKIGRLLDIYFPEVITDIIFDYHKMKLFNILYICGEIGTPMTIKASSVEEAQYLAELISLSNTSDEIGNIVQLFIDEISIKQYNEKNIQQMKDTIKSSEKYEDIEDNLIEGEIIVEGDHTLPIVKKTITISP